MYANTRERRSGFSQGRRSLVEKMIWVARRCKDCGWDSVTQVGMRLQREIGWVGLVRGRCPRLMLELALRGGNRCPRLRLVQAFGLLRAGTTGVQGGA